MRNHRPSTAESFRSVLVSQPRAFIPVWARPGGRRAGEVWGAGAPQDLAPTPFQTGGPL